MTSQVLKETLAMEVRQTVRWPVGSKVLHVDAQHQRPTIWFAAPYAGNESEDRHFCIVGTGHGAVTPEMEYLGTCFIDDYVWHIFEEKK